MDATQRIEQQRKASDIRQQWWHPVGADVLLEGGVHFRVWASQCQRVEVVLEGGLGHTPGAELVAVALEPEEGGYCSERVDEADVVDDGEEVPVEARSRLGVRHAY
jgi:hypothetical protein